MQRYYVFLSHSILPSPARGVKHGAMVGFGLARGTCGKDRVIRINWRLVRARLAAMEYVVAHEVCHLRYRTRSRAFWAYPRRRHAGLARAQRTARMVGGRGRGRNGTILAPNGGLLRPKALRAALAGSVGRPLASVFLEFFWHGPVGGLPGARATTVSAFWGAGGPIRSPMPNSQTAQWTPAYSVRSTLVARRGLSPGNHNM